MSKNFDCTALIFYLDGNRAKTLSEIASEFGVSVRTVQRRISEARDAMPGIEFRFVVSSGERAYSCSRKSGNMIPVARQKDLMTLHHLQMAVETFRVLGLLDYAQGFDELIENLMSRLARATRHSYRKILASLAHREAIILERRAPFADARIPKQIRLALLASRNVVFNLKTGESVIGTAQRLSFDINEGAFVQVTTNCGENVRINLSRITEIGGIDDLYHEYLC